MKKIDVITVGSAVKDIMFYSKDVFVIKNKNIKNPNLLAMAHGSKFLIDDVFVNYGGGALNVAVGLKNFGLNVAPMVNVGSDEVGKEIFNYLKNQKINTSLVNIDKGRKTAFSMVISSIKDKEHTIFSYKGASNYLKVQTNNKVKANYFYVSSLTNKNWQDEFAKLIKLANKTSKIVWNPGSKQLKDARSLINFLSSVEILILNKAEAIDLVSSVKKSTKKTQLANNKFLLKQIKDFGSQFVVITQGEKGVMAIDKNNNYYSYPARGDNKRIVDTVGAGDAFSSGFLAGLIKLKDFDRALQLGLENSSNVLYRIGAQNGLLKIKL